MNEFTKALLSDPSFIQSMKEFEEMGFIKVTKEGIQIIDREGMQKYIDNYGEAPAHFPKVEKW